MAKIRINGDTSGYIEISAPNVAGSTSITLPATTGGSLLATDASGNLNVDSGVLYVDGVNNRVGIGTTSPSTLFHVSGGRTYLSSLDGYELAFARTGNFFYFYNDGGNVTGKLSLTTTLGASGEIITFTQDTKRVGIGTTSPGSALTVSTTGSVLSGSNNTFGFYVNPISSGYIYLDALTSSTSNTSLALRTYNNGTYNTVLQSISGNDTTFATAGTERVRIDSSGRFLVGTSSASYSSTIVCQGNSGSSSGEGIVRLNRGTAVPTSGQTLGAIVFGQSAGNDGAYILGEADAAWSASNDYPTRLVFSTTADGASSPTERMRIDNKGTVTIKGVSTTLPIARLSGVSGGDGNYSVDIKQPNTAQIDFVQRWFTSSQQEATVFSLGSGNFFSLPMYSTVVGGTNRDVYIDNNGLLGYVSSIRSSKDNITEISDVSWLQLLNPVSFNRRQLNENKEYTDELYTELEYGLIAEEVEQVAPELCFYDDVGGEQELRGVHYNKLIAPMLKALQQANARIETLEAEVAALKAS